MANKILLRRDLSANWYDTDPVLAQGEPGYETDSGKIKIGNGTSAWRQLPYLQTNDLPPNSIGYLKNNGAGLLTWAPAEGTFSGDYNDLRNKPDIPTDVIELSDNNNLLKPAFVQELQSTISDLLPFDFGTITNRTVRNRLEWLLHQADIDNGTIISPANVDYDAGTLN